MQAGQIEEIRSFNRFYTKIIGLLDRHVVNSKYSLPEARILFEISHHPDITASDLISKLEIDKGYLSRILKKLEKEQLIDKRVSAQDKRVVNLRLSPSGKVEFEKLDRASSRQIAGIFNNHTADEIQSLIGQMKQIQKIISAKF